MTKKKKVNKKSPSKQSHLAELLSDKVFFTVYKDGKEWVAKTMTIVDDDLVIDTIHRGGLKYAMALFMRRVKFYIKSIR